jgi:hypothetical protein
MQGGAARRAGRVCLAHRRASLFDRRATSARHGWLLVTSTKYFFPAFCHAGGWLDAGGALEIVPGARFSASVSFLESHMVRRRLKSLKAQGLSSSVAISEGGRPGGYGHGTLPTLAGARLGESC